MHDHPHVGVSFQERVDFFHALKEPVWASAERMQNSVEVEENNAHGHHRNPLTLAKPVATETREGDAAMQRKSLTEVQTIVKNVAFMDRKFRVLEKGDGFVLQLEYMEADITTGKVEKQRARKWYVSAFSTETEIVETAFKACRVSMDHVLKEHFTYEVQRVYSPHFNVRARIMLSELLEFDGRDHSTSLELLCATDEDKRLRVFLAGKQVGHVWQTAEGWFGVLDATGEEIKSSSRTQAARWVASMAKP